MNRGMFLNVNWGLLAPVCILVIFSLTTLFSINVSLFKSQLSYLLVSLVVFFFFTHIHHKAVQLYMFPIYIVSIFLLFIVLFIGMESRGAMRWLDLFGIKIQFSEVLKPFIIIFFSTFLAEKKVSLKNFLMTFLFLFPIVLLIYFQPDLGNALIYLFAIILTLIIQGFSFIWFAMVFFLFSAISPIMWRFLHEYQRQRVLNFFYPDKDPLGNSYNAIQAVIAVGSGMFFGKGFNQTTQSGLRFLPERHTDFIFATISESLGFLGSLILILSFAFLLYKIFIIFSNSDDGFYKLLAAFSFSFLLVQFSANVGMNIGVLPIVGVTLPFVSYGGSSLLSNFIILGLLSSSNSVLREKRVLEIK